MCFASQPWEMAPTGQVSAQEPQSMQASLMTYWLSPWEMALMGHPSAQEPQEMQASLITYIIRSSFLYVGPGKLLFRLDLHAHCSIVSGIVKLKFWNRSKKLKNRENQRKTEISEALTAWNGENCLL